MVHAAAVILVAAFLGMGWWQLNRAASGNLLSFGYAIEWPAFAGFVIWVWIKEMRKAVRPGEAPAATTANDAPRDVPPPRPAGARTTRQAPRSGPAYDDTSDDELTAYNHYLAWRNANPHAKPAEYRPQP